MNKIIIWTDTIILPIIAIILITRKIYKDTKKEEKIKIINYLFTITLPLIFVIIISLSGTCEPKGITIINDLLIPIIGWTSKLSACMNPTTATITTIKWAGIGIITDETTKKIGKWIKKRKTTKKLLKKIRIKNEYEEKEKKNSKKALKN